MVVVSANQVPEAQATLHQLSKEVRAILPNAAWVLVTSGLGLSLLDLQGEPLDLTPMSFDLHEQVVTFFSFGMYGLPGSAAPACQIRGVTRK